MEKCKVTVKKPGETTITFTKLTAGEVLALTYALENYSTPVGRDLYAYLSNALTRVER